MIRSKEISRRGREGKDSTIRPLQAWLLYSKTPNRRKRLKISKTKTKRTHKKVQVTAKAMTDNQEKRKSHRSQAHK